MRITSLLLTLAVGASGLVLTPENYAEKTKDKQAYEGYMKDKEAAEAALKGQGLGLAKAVRKSLEAKTDEL